MAEDYGPNNNGDLIPNAQISERLSEVKEYEFNLESYAQNQQESPQNIEFEPSVYSREINFNNEDSPTFLKSISTPNIDSAVNDIFGSSESEADQPNDELSDIGEEDKNFEGFRDSEIEQEEEGCSAYKHKKKRRTHKKFHYHKEESNELENHTLSKDEVEGLNVSKIPFSRESLGPEFNIDQVAQENSDASSGHENSYAKNAGSADDNKVQHDNADDLADETKVLPPISDEEEDGNKDVGRSRKSVDNLENNAGLTDFDIMMDRKKAENRRTRAMRRRFTRNDGDFINDSDDMISALLGRMKMAWEEDRISNNKKEPAFKKLTVLPTVITHLRRVDLQNAFLDAGVLSAFAEWLQPLPDKTLPHLQIREEILKILLELPPVEVSTLNNSFIGKAVMYLFKHPRETKQNKARAEKLINEWSRSMFNIPADFKALSKEEREERDYYLMNHFKPNNAPERRDSASSSNPNGGQEEESAGPAIRYASGKYGRARIPQPSAKDYVIRPKSKINIAEINQKKPLSIIKNSRMEKYKKMVFNSRRSSGNSGSDKNKRAVGISLEGRKMEL